MTPNPEGPTAAPAQARRKVFLVDDHPLVREWLANVINQQPDLVVCGQAEGRADSLEAIVRKRPDVAIVDLSLQDCSGFDLIAEIKQRAPSVEVVVLSMHDSVLYARRAIGAGAAAYVVKRETTRKICSAIRAALQGRHYISQMPAQTREAGFPPVEHLDLSALSERELEIFRFLGLGNSTRHIADTLGISIKTVQVHCGNIREKLGIESPTELLSAAVRWNERHPLGELG